jgi:hypothetical protein
VLASPFVACSGVVPCNGLESASILTVAVWTRPDYSCDNKDLSQRLAPHQNACSAPMRSSELSGAADGELYVRGGGWEGAVYLLA